MLNLRFARRTLLRLLPALMLAPIIAAATPAPVRAAAAKGTSENPYRIDLVVFRGCEEACQGFQHFLNSSKISVDVHLFDAETDASRIPGFVEEIKRRRPDLVVTWGTTTALKVFGPYDAADPQTNITDIPGVFMIVSQPLESKVVPDLASSGRNITGTNYLVPESVQLEAAQTYFKFQRIGVVYTPTERNSVINVEQLTREAQKLGMAVTAQPVALDAEGKPDADSIPAAVAKLVEAKVDLVYQGADTFLNINRELLTSEAVKQGLPVFAAGEAPVRTAHALMGVVNQYYVVGQLTALKAMQVLEGATPASIPIEAPRRFSFLVNLRVAKQLELYPPMKLIRFAEFIK